MGAAAGIDDLREISARIGGDPLLAQAATGNTSVKLDGVLWVKASGKWLAHALAEEIFVPVNLAQARVSIARGEDPRGLSVTLGGNSLSTSIETAMHAVLPGRVVLHVHSVNTIAFAVRRDGPAALAERLAGIDWQWIPYRPSGLSLAHAIAAALANRPETRVFVLANHGLIVSADSCESAEALLREVESRVATQPRPAPDPQWAALDRIAAETGWSAPGSAAIHAIATDCVARRIVCGGVLYPCQAMFLTTRVQSYSPSAVLDSSEDVDRPFVIVEDTGILARHKSNAVEAATLLGLAEVLRRIPEAAPVRYLTGDQVDELLQADVYRYRQMVNTSAPAIPVAERIASPVS